MEPWRQELYHHGIKGQKWGVRRGPPYPLNPSARSVSAKRATPSSFNGRLSYLSGKRAEIVENNPDENEKKKHIRKPRRAFVYAGIGATVAVAAYMAYRNRSSSLVENSDELLDIAKGLVQTQADVEISALGKTFLNASEFNSEIQRIATETKDNVRKHFDDDFFKKLTEPEMKAVKDYTMDSFLDVNRLLRGIPVTRPNPNDVAKTKEQIELISSAIDKSELPFDVVAYRGCGLKSAYKMLGIDESYDLNTLIGRKFVDDGFYSMSIESKRAYVAKKDGVKITTILPKGAKAMYLEKISHYSTMEYEILNQCHSEYRVIDFETNDIGKLVGLTVEVVVDKLDL